MSDLDRFIALGLPSLERCFDPTIVRELIVIVPPRDVARVRHRLSRSSAFDIRVLDETALVSATLRTDGWTKQQILKLAAAYVVSTDWYLTLDADIVATRPVTAALLFPDGRALWQREPALAHAEWWQASARVLGLPSLASAEAAFGVTPALLHAASVRGMTQVLADRQSDGSWVLALAARETGWTEYSLYWTFCVDRGLDVAKYTSLDEPALYSVSASVWTRGDLADLDARLRAAFNDPGRAIFFVFQSNMEVSLGETVDLIGPAVRGRGASASEKLRWKAHGIERSLAAWRNRARRLVTRAPTTNSERESAERT